MVAGHAAGWPVAKGGSDAIAKAMVEYLQSLGGEVVCGWCVPVGGGRRGFWGERSVIPPG